MSRKKSYRMVLLLPKGQKEKMLMGVNAAGGSKEDEDRTLAFAFKKVALHKAALKQRWS